MRSDRRELINAIVVLVILIAIAAIGFVSLQGECIRDLYGASESALVVEDYSYRSDRKLTAFAEKNNTPVMRTIDLEYAGTVSGGVIGVTPLEAAILSGIQNSF